MLLLLNQDGVFICGSMSAGAIDRVIYDEESRLIGVLCSGRMRRLPVRPTDRSRSSAADIVGVVTRVIVRQGRYACTRT